MVNMRRGDPRPPPPPPPPPLAQLTVSDSFRSTVVVVYLACARTYVRSSLASCWRTNWPLDLALHGMHDAAFLRQKAAAKTTVARTRSPPATGRHRASSRSGHWATTHHRRREMEVEARRARRRPMCWTSPSRRWRSCRTRWTSCSGAPSPSPAPPAGRAPPTRTALASCRSTGSSTAHPASRSTGGSPWGTPPATVVARMASSRQTRRSYSARPGISSLTVTAPPSRRSRSSSSSRRCSSAMAASPPHRAWRIQLNQG